MQSINLYSYSPHRVVNIYLGIEGTNNMQFQNNTIEVFKGALNPIKFTLMNSDNKPLSYSATSVYELVVFSNEGEVLFRKMLNVDSTSTLNAEGSLPTVKSNNFVRTIFSTEITVSDLMSVEISNSYKWVINSYDTTTQEIQYFYSALNSVPQGEFHVKPFYTEFMKPSTVCTTWKQYTEYKYLNSDIVGSEINSLSKNWNVFISDVVVGNTKGSTDSNQGTIVLYMNNFSGSVVVQGTIESMPPDDQSYSRWFNIPDAQGNTIFTYDNFTGTDALVIDGKFSYVRIAKYQQMSTTMKTVDTGTLNRAIVRF